MDSLSRAALRLPTTLLVALAITACSPPPPPETPPPAPAPPASAAPTETAAPAPPAPDPDSDGDGTPDRCDACPQAPGVPWDNLVSIDGCDSGRLHSLVRPPEALVERILYLTDTDLGPPAPDALGAIVTTLEAPSIEAIAIVGRFAGSTPKAEAQAKERARRVQTALQKAGVKAAVTLFTAPFAGGAVDIAVLRRSGKEELVWRGAAFEHVDLPAFLEKKARAEAAPSPCGRLPGKPFPPP